MMLSLLINLLDLFFIFAVINSAKNNSIHCLLIFGLVSLTIPYQKQEIKKKPIESYLVFENSVDVSESVNDTSDLLDEVILEIDTPKIILWTEKQ
jgi:hypothetical protein